MTTGDNPLTLSTNENWYDGKDDVHKEQKSNYYGITIGLGLLQESFWSKMHFLAEMDPEISSDITQWFQSKSEKYLNGGEDVYKLESGDC